MSSTIATIGRSTQYPSTGFLRFGIPWLLVCALVVAYRRDRPARAPLLAAYALVGVAAVWSFETAFYTGATFAVTVVVVAWTRPDGQRVRCAATPPRRGRRRRARRHRRARRPRPSSGAAGRRTSAATSTSCASTPSPGFGQLPVPGWSLGYLMGALYVALAGRGLPSSPQRGRGGELARPSTIVPLAAVSTFGAVSLTYFLGRSHPNNLTHVAPPFVVMVTLWTALAWRAWARDRNPIAAVGVAAGGVCALPC